MANNVQFANVERYVEQTNITDKKTTKVNAVREQYKRYKKRNPPPDFSDVIDFERPSTYRGKVKPIDLSISNLYCKSSGLIDPKNWKVFEVVSCPGFLFIVNPFKDGVQHYFIQRSLKDFPSKPNVTNLDAHMSLNEKYSIWDISKKSEDVSPKLIERLRWAHLGYQFDYNNEEYKPETYYGFPQDLSNLTCHIATMLGYPSYRPESGVVNYYPFGSSMGGHVDKYENDLSQPLVSISFGQSAIYLIGGKTNDIHPEALFVKSGDIIVMTKESRLAYHAVPCIVRTDNEIPGCLTWDNCIDYKNIVAVEGCSHKKLDSFCNVYCSICNNQCDCQSKLERLKEFSKNEEEWKHFESYLSKTRININVRQVHKPQENVQLYHT